MNQFKRAQVVMLPTKKNSSNIAKSINQDILSLYNKNDDKYNQWINQHLYILSDDEIEETDWFILLMDYGLHELHNRKTTNIKHWDNNYAWTKDCKKIIATTDISIACIKDTLSIVQRKGLTNHYPTEKWILPQPSQQFIEKYIESYNCGKIITDILVEYERCKTTLDQGRIFNFNNNTQSHICSECNFNNIHPIKKPGQQDDLCENFILKINPKDNTITIKKLKDSWDREEVTEILLDRGISKEWIEKNL